MSIALLCPTYARPTQFKRMVQSAMNTAHYKGNVKTYAAFTHGDVTIGEYEHQGVVRDFLWPDGMPTAFKWNRLAELAMQDHDIKLFMLCADDVVFSTPCWDKALLDHYNALENKIHVYHLRDGRTGDGTPHPIVTREYIQAMGYFLPPLFLHWFIDTWTVEMARNANCFTHLQDYMLDHIKPSDSGKADHTHTRIRNNGWHDRDMWTNQRCQHLLDFEKRRLMTYFSKSLRAVS